MGEHLAPGKLVLLGEYAVLDGAPAVVCAVDRGVRCVLTPSERREHITPGDDRFVAAALDACDAPAGTYTFSTWNPVDAETKVGFGHSAAATVAALHAAGLRGDELLARALAVHHQVQGSGSGVDVAASAVGGVLRFQAGAASPLPAIEPIVVWSGASALTGPRVSAYSAWADERARAAFVDRSTAVVEAMASDPIAALREARSLLAQMSLAAGVAWDTPALHHLGDLAEQLGGAAKPSGAGGGDCLVALFPDDERARDYVDRVRAEGFTVIPTRLAPGVRRVE